MFPQMANRARLTALTRRDAPPSPGGKGVGGEVVAGQLAQGDV
jgi:hypothetical protein